MSFANTFISISSSSSSSEEDNDNKLDVPVGVDANKGIDTVAASSNPKRKTNTGTTIGSGVVVKTTNASNISDSNSSEQSATNVTLGRINPTIPINYRTLIKDDAKCNNYYTWGGDNKSSDYYRNDPLKRVVKSSLHDFKAKNSREDKSTNLGPGPAHHHSNNGIEISALRNLPIQTSSSTINERKQGQGSTSTIETPQIIAPEAKMQTAAQLSDYIGDTLLTRGDFRTTWPKEDDYAMKLCDRFNCIDYPVESSKFCSYHKCQSYGCANDRPIYDRLEGIFSGYLCSQHECVNVNCKMEKFVDRLHMDRSYQYCHNCLCGELMEDGTVCPNVRLTNKTRCLIHENAYQEKYGYGFMTAATLFRHRGEHPPPLHQGEHPPPLAPLHQGEDPPPLQQHKEEIDDHQCVNVYMDKQNKVQHRCSGVVLNSDYYCDNCLCIAQGCDQPVKNVINRDRYCRKHTCHEPKCHQFVSNEQQFCSEHRCHQTIDGERCSKRAYDYHNWYCVDHLCHYEDCVSCRATDSKYCSLHYEFDY